MGCSCSGKNTKEDYQRSKLSKEWYKIVASQKSNALCQVITNSGQATGFLCLIPNPVLITSNQVLNSDHIKPGSEIKISFTDQEGKKQSKTIKITEERATFTAGKVGEEEIDTTIIQIKPDEDRLENKEFIEIDENLMNEDVKNYYEKNDCYLIHYHKGENLMTSLGKINEIENKNTSFTIYHSIKSDEGSSGGPIILFNNKVIGVNGKSTKKEKLNRATLLKYPIKEYLKKFNEITMIYKINKEEEEIKILCEDFVEENKGKCKLIINKKEYDLCEKIKYDKYGINKEDDLLTVILVENKNEKITTMNLMFNNCKSLISLNFSTFNAQNVTSMLGMFSECSSLTSINFTSFNTENVTDMMSMFRKCSSLISLDLSSFNTKKVINMWYMFSNCSSLKSLDLSSFNTENVIVVSEMFKRCKSLTSLNLSSFNTKKISSMWQMFTECFSLTSLDLSSFNTENVTEMSQMFQDCKSLTSINLSSFNTKKVTICFKCFLDAHL